MVLSLSLLVMILGAVLYLILLPGPVGPKVAELAKWAFFCGLLTFLLAVGGRAAL